MDWSRTKTILIAAFLLLDLFLGYQVYETRINSWSGQEIVQSDKGEVELYLSEHEISLETEVPRETPEMGYLHAEYLGINPFHSQEHPGIEAKLEEMSLVVTLDPPLQIKGQILPNDLLRQLGSLLMYKEEYGADLYQSSQGRLLYWQTYGKRPVFVAPLEVYLDKGNIVGYSQTYLHLRELEGARKVISGYTALRSLVEKKIILPGERIESVSLGYYGSYDADIQSLVPAWRVIHDGKIHFVNAFTGALERPIAP
jgi:regulatory protein YycI of two-component signal transduction system YycFG